MVPGQWSASDLEYVADSVAAGLTNNAGGAPGVEGKTPANGATRLQPLQPWRRHCLHRPQAPLSWCSPCMSECLPLVPPPPGHNCLKAELLVTDRSWPQREAFLDALRAKLASLPNRVAYYPGLCAALRASRAMGGAVCNFPPPMLRCLYCSCLLAGSLPAAFHAPPPLPGSPPGSDAKHSAFLSRFGDAEQLGPGDTAADGAQLASNSGRAEMHVTPWLLKTGLTPQQAATQDENWCGVLQVGGGQHSWLPI